MHRVQKHHNLFDEKVKAFEILGSCLKNRHITGSQTWIIIIKIIVFIEKKQFHKVLKKIKCKS